MSTIEKTSAVSGQGHRVTIDPYAANPLAADYQQVNPENYATAEHMAGPPPKLFAAGTSDLPAFTASGIDPSLLMKLPYTARHATAAEPDIATVHAIFEQSAGNPDYALRHEGLDAAVRRVRDWAAGRRDNQTGATA